MAQSAASGVFLFMEDTDANNKSIMYKNELAWCSDLDAMMYKDNSDVFHYLTPRIEGVNSFWKRTGSVIHPWNGTDDLRSNNRFAIGDSPLGSKVDGVSSAREIYVSKAALLGYGDSVNVVTGDIELNNSITGLDNKYVKTTSSNSTYNVYEQSHTGPNAGHWFGTGYSTGAAGTAANFDYKVRFNLDGATFNYDFTNGKNFIVNGDAAQMRYQGDIGCLGVGVTPVEKIHSSNGLKLGSAIQTTDGTMQFKNGFFEFRQSGMWVRLTDPNASGAYTFNAPLKESAFNVTLGYNSNEFQIISNDLHLKPGSILGIDHTNLINNGNNTHSQIDNFMTLSGINSLYQTKSMTIMNAITGEKIPFWVTERNIRILDYRYIVVDDPGYSGVYNSSFRLMEGGHFQDPSAGAVLTLNSVSPTNGTSGTLNYSINQNRHLWLETTSQGGVTTLAITLRYLTHR